MTFIRCYKHHGAFTLAELLIALSVLGLIATVTILKVTTSWQEQHSKSVLKNDIEIIETIVHEGSLTGELNANTSDTQLRDFFTARLNWQSRDIYSDNTFFYMPDGSVIRLRYCCIGDCTASNMSTITAGSWIDYNGNAPPNIVGEDRLHIRVTWGQQSRYGCGFSYKRGVTPDSGFAGSTSLYNSLFN